MKPCQNTDSCAKQNAIDELRGRYPWPTTRPDFKEIDWSLDGGGRWLIEKCLRDRNIRIILEIGSFLGGSVRHWLKVCPEAIVIAVDPWSSDWDVSKYAKDNGKSRWIVDQLARPEGFYQTFLANLWDLRQNVIPVRGYSPGVLEEVASLGIQPDLVYLDSDKVGDEISLCHQLFPGAIMTGDDWEWTDENGEIPIRKPVMRFCEEHGRFLIAENATWMIDDQPPSLSFRFRTWRRALKQRRREQRKVA